MLSSIRSCLSGRLTGCGLVVSPFWEGLVLPGSVLQPVRHRRKPQTQYHKHYPSAIREVEREGILKKTRRRGHLELIWKKLLDDKYVLSSNDRGLHSYGSPFGRDGPLIDLPVTEALPNDERSRRAQFPLWYEVRERTPYEIRKKRRYEFSKHDAAFKATCRKKFNF